MGTHHPAFLRCKKGLNEQALKEHQQSQEKQPMKIQRIHIRCHAVDRDTMSHEGGALQ